MIRGGRVRRAKLYTASLQGKAAKIMEITARVTFQPSTEKSSFGSPFFRAELRPLPDRIPVSVLNRASPP